MGASSSVRNTVRLTEIIAEKGTVEITWVVGMVEARVQLSRRATGGGLSCRQLDGLGDCQAAWSPRRSVQQAVIRAMRDR